MWDILVGGQGHFISTFTLQRQHRRHCDRILFACLCISAKKSSTKTDTDMDVCTYIH